ncbi:MAG: MFS transporter [Magnetospirillum sp.]|nr:MFS transporter [Magnetospirillum sp.]
MGGSTRSTVSGWWESAWLRCWRGACRMHRGNRRRWRRFRCGSAWARLRVPSFYWLMGAFLGMLLVNTAYLAWMPTLLHERFGLALSSAGFHAAIYHQVGALIGVLVGGKLSDAWLARTMLGRPLTQIVGLVLGIPFIAVLGLSGDKNVVYGALGIFGICRGLFDAALFTSLFAVMPTQVRGLATGMMISLAFLGGGFAPWLVGLLAQSHGLGPALAWSASGYGLGALCLAVALLTVYRRDAERAHSM